MQSAGGQLLGWCSKDKTNNSREFTLSPTDNELGKGTGSTRCWFQERPFNQWGRNMRNSICSVGHACTQVWIEFHSYPLLLYVWIQVLDYAANFNAIMWIIRPMVVRPLTENSVWVCLKPGWWGGSSFPKSTKSLAWTRSQYNDAVIVFSNIYRNSTYRL